MAFFRRKAEHPVGWHGYRQTLRSLYDGHIAANPKQNDAEIDRLFFVTEYADGENVPDFTTQWALLNQIDLRLVRIVSDTQLIEETRRKLTLARRMGVPEVDGYGARLDDLVANGTLDERRAFAVTLISEVFGVQAQEFVEREKRRGVAVRLIRLGLWLVGLPFSVMLVLSFAIPIFAEFDWKVLERIKPSNWQKSELTVFFFVLYFGIIGAYFSRLARYANNMQSLSWNDLDLGFSAGAINVRLLVGAIAALILFFLMMGDILSGPIFLNEDNGPVQIWLLKADGEPVTPLRPTDEFARLIVWCIVAGFSERFVSDRLGEVSESARGSGNRPQP